MNIRPGLTMMFMIWLTLKTPPTKKLVKGRWALTAKRDKDGQFVARKARWVLTGYQDKQKLEQHIDSPKTCQLATIRNWHLSYVDMKTACPQRKSLRFLRRRYLSAST